MSSKRLHTVLIALLVLLFAGLLGGVYGVNKLLTSKAGTLTAAKAKSQALEQEQVSLQKAKKDIQRYASLNQIAETVVPQDKNQAEAVREIVNIAAANGVTLTAISFPASSLGTLPNGSPATGSSGTSSGSGQTGRLSQLTPVKNIPGVYQLPITISNDSSHPVSYDRFINFLSDLEHNRRTAQVQTISVEPDTKNSALITFSLTVSEYIKP